MVTGLSFVGAVSAAATSATLPTGWKPGDLAIVYAFRDGSVTAPTLATGYASINTGSTGAGATGAADISGYKRLAANDTTTGVWTNATDVAVIVLRGDWLTATGFAMTGAATNQVNYPFYTAGTPDGRSWAVGFAASRTATDVSSGAVPGMTTRSDAVNTSMGMHTQANETGNFPSTNWTGTINAATTWRCHIIEVQAAADVIYDTAGHVWQCNPAGTASITRAGPASSSYLNLPAAITDYAFTVDDPTLEVSGDIDIRACVQLVDWSPVTDQHIVVKYGGANSMAYRFLVGISASWGVANCLVLQVSPTGADAVAVSSVSTVGNSFVDNTVNWIRGTLDVVNATNRVAKFYTSTDPTTTDPSSVTWTQLGTTVTTAGTTSIADTIAPVCIGGFNYDGTDQPSTSGRVHYADVRNGYDGAGSIVLAADFRISDERPDRAQSRPPSLAAVRQASSR